MFKKVLECSRMIQKMSERYRNDPEGYGMITTDLEGSGVLKNDLNYSRMF
jgi:hypothetical protein